MAILDERTAEQLRTRFSEKLTEPVELRLYTRPGTGRLILPSGYGCATCDDARELAEALAEAAPEKVTLEVVDVSQTGEEREVPELTVSAPGQEARISWMGLPTGFEFATDVDAIERISAAEPGLSERTVERLEGLTEPVEVMVFATPT